MLNLPTTLALALCASGTAGARAACAFSGGPGAYDCPAYVASTLGWYLGGGSPPVPCAVAWSHAVADNAGPSSIHHECPANGGTGPSAWASPTWQACGAAVVAAAVAAGQRHCPMPAPPPPPPPPPPPAAQFRGFEIVSGLWDAPAHNHTFGGADALGEMSRYAAGLAADAVAISFNGFVNDTGTPGPFYTQGFSPTAAQVAAQVHAAQAGGLRVMLRPIADAQHCAAGDPYCSGGGGGGGGHAIGFNFSAADWDAYTDAYIAWQAPWARLAQQLNVSLFCIGVESWRQDRSSGGNPRGEANMRRVAAAARALYAGPLVYSANDGVLDIAWWDAVDYIGYDAYYPLQVAGKDPTNCSWPAAAAAGAPSVPELVAAFAPFVAQVAAVAEKFSRPVLFTEVGYRACPGSHACPGSWCDPAKASAAAQANLAEALLQAWWAQPWFGGLFWWNIYTDPARNADVSNFVPVPETMAVFRRHWSSQSSNRQQEQEQGTTSCPAGKFLRVSTSDSLEPGGVPCECRDSHIGPDGGCSSLCSSCACCCGSGGFVAAYASGTYRMCLADAPPAPTPAPAPTPVAPPALAAWLNSSSGVHSFLTFDSRASAARIAAHAREADFVWGATEAHVAAWRASPQPGAVLAKYIPFCRDPIAPQHQNQSGPSPPASGLPWWQARHPELVLYRCDRTTPAWECFAGEGCSHAYVPLDLAQPAALAYQLEAAVRPARAAGYSAIGLDNYGLSNSWAACGSFSGPGGAWVQRYSGAAADAQYRADVLGWTARAVAAIHAEGLLVIPNFSDQGADGLAVGQLVDGLLAEAGFAEWNPVPNTSSFDTPPPMTTPAKFAKQVGFVRQLQRAGVGYFAINEWGAGADYGLNPAEVPYNISGAAHRSVRQFVVAAFLMVNGGACGIFLSCIQCYGNFSTWPEYAYGAAVGHPLGEPAKDTGTGVWARAYSGGLALVNPSNDAAQSVLLPSGSWKDLYGGPVASPVQLPMASGLVLLQTREEDEG